MKYVFSFILLVFVCLLLSACEDKTQKIIRHGTGNLVLEYTNEPQEMMNSKYIIRLYDSGLIEYGNESDEELNSKMFSEEEYDDIITLAFSKEMKKLESKNISDSNVLDGYWTYITMYNEDGSSFRVGGSNPNNKYFNKLCSLLRNQTNKK